MYALMHTCIHPDTHTHAHTHTHTHTCTHLCMQFIQLHTSTHNETYKQHTCSHRTLTSKTKTKKEENWFKANFHCFDLFVLLFSTVRSWSVSDANMIQARHFTLGLVGITFIVTCVCLHLLTELSHLDGARLKLGTVYYIWACDRTCFAWTLCILYVNVSSGFIFVWTNLTLYKRVRFKQSKR